jgi:hypothetical protein
VIDEIPDPEIGQLIDNQAIIQIVHNLEINRTVGHIAETDSTRTIIADPHRMDPVQLHQIPEIIHRNDVHTTVIEISTQIVGPIAEMIANILQINNADLNPDISLQTDHSIETSGLTHQKDTLEIREQLHLRHRNL